jgi:hypothetical protein
MKIGLLIVALAAAFAVGGGFALADGNSPATQTLELASTSTAGDISGPCDEAEHANDPRCTGQPGPVVPTGTTTVDASTDISGPCDEAEHANDPRCTGQVGDDDNSNRGPGGGGGGEDNSSSGPGSGDGADDNSNSGPGSGDDDADDDDNSNSGPGGGDDD